MNKSRREDEAWHYRLQALFAEPDTTPIMVNGEEWTRDHPLHCPVCGVLFFGYQPVARPMEPYYDRPDTECRQTCGHPKCWEVETDRHMKLSGAYARACAARFATPETEPVVKVQKLVHL